MKILTFNHHEAFLSTLSLVGHSWDVVTSLGKKDLTWNRASHPLPPNFKSIKFDQEGRNGLQRGAYDFVVCHKLSDLKLLFFKKKQKIVFIIHVSLRFLRPLESLKSVAKLAFLRLFCGLHQVQVVAVSEMKRSTWHIDAKVIPLATNTFSSPLPPADYQKVVVVCNDLLKRKHELGYDGLEEIMQKIPITFIGRNPGVPSNIQPRDYAQFVHEFAQARIYLFTTKYPYNDGYNTALLEAMSLGMAVVSLAHPTSPIIHGVNGLIGNSSAEIIELIQSIRGRPEIIDKLGAKAKETIEQKFSQTQFVETWKKIFT